MKLIDILNMMSKGELKEGTTFMHNGNIFVYKDSLILNTENTDNFSVYGWGALNEDVRLIEPDHFTDGGKMETEKIEELDIDSFTYGDEKRAILKTAFKLNEVIRRINNVR